MSQAEHPERRAREVTIDDVRQLSGASTPHFALQIRNRIATLVRGLPADHPARVEGEREIERLTRLGFTGEVRGTPHEDGIEPLPSLGADATIRRDDSAQGRAIGPAQSRDRPIGGPAA